MISLNTHNDLRSLNKLNQLQGNYSSSVTFKACKTINTQQSLPQINILPGYKQMTVPLSSIMFKGSSTVPKEITILSPDEIDKVIKHMPAPYELFELLAKTGKTYAGAIPEEFNSIDNKKLFETLDKLANILRAVDCHLPLTMKSGDGAFDCKLPPVKLNVDGAILTCKKVGHGEVGHVYKITVKNGNKSKDFAFKVFYDPSRIDVHGSYGETGYGLYFSNKSIKDCLKVHFSNPSEGWMVNEWLSEETDLNNRGNIGIKSFLKKENFFLSDDWSPNYGPKGILWDLGGLEPEDNREIKTFEDFKKLFDSPKTRMNAGRRISRLNSDDRIKAIKLCLQYPETRAQAARDVRRISDDQKRVILLEALNYLESAGRAAYEIDFLPEENRAEAFHKAIESNTGRIEPKIEATKMISLLPAKDRKAAFDVAWKHPECRPMATRSIFSLPVQEQQDAINKATSDPGSRFILLSMRSAYSKSNDTARMEALTEYLKLQGLPLDDNTTQPLIGKSAEIKKVTTPVTLNPDDFHRNAPTKVDDNLYRGGQFNENGLKYLASIGIKTIVDFRDHNYASSRQLQKEDEELLASEYGIKYVNIPLSEHVPPSAEQINKFLEVFNNKSDVPVYIHCKSGSDRAGIMGAIYRVEKNNLDFNAAYDEMLQYCHDFKAFSILDDFLDAYCRQKEGSHPIEHKIAEIQEKWKQQMYERYYPYLLSEKPEENEKDTGTNIGSMLKKIKKFKL